MNLLRKELTSHTDVFTSINGKSISSVYEAFAGVFNKTETTMDPFPFPIQRRQFTQGEIIYHPKAPKTQGDRFEFAIWDVVLITLKVPFDISVPYVNPICLLPSEMAKHEADWDGEFFTIVGNEKSYS